MKQVTKSICAILLLIQGLNLEAQNLKSMSLNQLLEQAQKSNPSMLLAEQRIEKVRKLQASAFNIQSPEVLFEAPTSTELRPGVLQNIDFPTRYLRNYQTAKKETQITAIEKEMAWNELRLKIRLTYTELQYLKEVYESYLQQDSLLEDLVEVTGIRHQVGQISALEKLNAEAQYKEIRYQLGQVKTRLQTTRLSLALLTGNPSDSSLNSSEALAKAQFQSPLQEDAFAGNPQNKWYEQNISLQHSKLKQERSGWFPGLVVGYLNQGPDQTPLNYRMRYGFTLPLWFWQNISKVGAQKKELEIAEQQALVNRYGLTGVYQETLSGLKQYGEALNYYEQTALPQASQLAREARESYRLGSIGYYHYLINLQQVIKIRLGYLEALKNYNQTAYTFQFLKGE